MIADRVVIKRHGEGAKHVKKTTAVPGQSSIATTFEKAKQSDDEKCKASEIKLAAFMAEHKISLRAMDHLIDLLPIMFPDSQIAKNMKMKRTKCQAIINSILGESEKQDLYADLKEHKFSVMIDESTDIGAVKTMCVVVRYYCAIKGQIVSRFWDLIQIHGDEISATVAAATAQHLFEAEIKSFEENSIPTENIIGFGSDGCETVGRVLLDWKIHAQHLDSSKLQRGMRENV
ncbi:unnamed protein product [Chilo suppressalis]|uniref:DUF4371 domain-containing protein n=1 Tax=Chilo suppressalis TaxID=168631 RepID=A0ABN8ASX2_CHISP|nr:unnamed protein product [Chilo suppressalis]